MKFCLKQGFSQRSAIQKQEVKNKQRLLVWTNLLQS